MNSLRKVIRNFIVYIIILTMIVDTVKVSDMTGSLAEFIQDNAIAYADSIGIGVGYSAQSGIATGTYGYSSFKITLVTDEDNYDYTSDLYAQIYNNYAKGPAQVHDDSSRTVYVAAGENLGSNIFNNGYAVGYNPSSGDLYYCTAGKLSSSKVLQASLTANVNTAGRANGVFYNSIKGMSGDEIVSAAPSLRNTYAAQAANAISWICNTTGRVNPGSNYGGSSYEVFGKWNIIFASDPATGAVLDYDKIGEWTDEQKDAATYKFIDGLLCLWSFSGNSLYLEAAKDIADGNTAVGTYMIQIEPCVIFHNAGNVNGETAGRNEWYLISAIDYIMLAGQVERAYALGEYRADTAYASSDALYIDIINKSYNTEPVKRDRSIIGTGSNKNNGFSWALSAITKSRLKYSAYNQTTHIASGLKMSGGTTISYANSVSLKSGFNKGIGSNTDIFGYTVIASPQAGVTSKLGLKLTATPKNERINSVYLGANLSKSSAASVAASKVITPTKPVSLKISSTMSQDEVSGWATEIQSAISSGKTFNVKVNWKYLTTSALSAAPAVNKWSWASVGTSDDASAHSTGLKNSLAVGWSNKTIAGATSGVTTKTYTAGEMNNFLHGLSNITVVDNVTGYNLNTAGLYNASQLTSESIFLLWYEANITIAVNDGTPTGRTVYTGNLDDYASFIYDGFRYGPNSYQYYQTEEMHYTSEPESYSELKNYGINSNMSGTLSEDFEVMAGVPSTEQLYYAVGGSEFIVDIDLNTVNDETAYRCYDYYYNGTSCQFKSDDQDNHNSNRTVPSYSGKLLTGSDYTMNIHSGDVTVSCTISGTIKNDATAVTNSGSGSVTATCPAQPNSGDLSDRSSAYASLQQWVTSAQNTIKGWSWTAASDKYTRRGSQVTITTSLPGCPSNVPQTTTASKSKYHPETSGNPPVTVQVPDPVTATAQPGAAVSWSVTATITIPAHCLCGPCCEHELPTVHDTWTQTIQYDTVEINNVHVWRIDQGALDGLSAIISDDLVTVDHVKGTPNIFYNIALKNDAGYKNRAYACGYGKSTHSATVGRIWYSFEPESLDYVTHCIGTRTNTCDGTACTLGGNAHASGGHGHSEAWGKGFIYTSSSEGVTYNTHAGNQKHGETASKVNPRGNAWDTISAPSTTGNVAYNHMDDTDRKTPEGTKFISLRNQTIYPIMATDFLILQTSNGDQSVMYYQKASSKSVYVDQQMMDIDTNMSTYKLDTEANIQQQRGQGMTEIKAEMWTNNPYSAANWSTKQINVGSYNGNYASPSAKFSGRNTLGYRTVATLFDAHYAGALQVMTRPTRPGTKLMMYLGQLNIKVDDTNKAYYTGYPEVFWSNQLHWFNGNFERVVSDEKSYPLRGITSKTSTALTNIDTTAKLFKKNTDARWDYTSKAKYQFSQNDYVTNGGFLKLAEYYEGAGKTNDIIVQDPVSTMYTKLIALPDYRDQRTSEGTGAKAYIHSLNEAETCPGVASMCDYSVLNCNYTKDEVIFKATFDNRASNNAFINSVTGNAISTTSGFSLASNSSLDGVALKAVNGTRLSIPFDELGISYGRGIELQVESDIVISPTGGHQMIFSFNGVDLWLPATTPAGTPGNTFVTFNSGVGWERMCMTPLADGNKHHIKVLFSFAKIDSCRLWIDGVECSYRTINASNSITSTNIGTNFNIGSWGANSNYPCTMWLDNLTITRLAGKTYHTDDCYESVTVHKGGNNAHQHTLSCLIAENTEQTTPDTPVKNQYNYAGRVQAVTLQPGTYTIQAWGAAGGDAYSPRANHSYGSHAGYGGYSYGELAISSATTLYILNGGAGTYGAGASGFGGPLGGYNGGGSGGNSASGSGGGGTSVFLASSVEHYWGSQAGTVGTVSGTSRTGSGNWYTGGNTARTAGTYLKVEWYGSNLQNCYPDFFTYDTNYGSGGVANSSAKGALIERKIYSDHIEAYYLVKANVGVFESRLQASGNITVTEKYIYTLNSPLLVAGGGGGTDNSADYAGVGSADDGSGGDGGGTTGQQFRQGGPLTGSYATQTGGFSMGCGANVSNNTDSGGAGGGYFGGYVSNHNNGGGSGGSGYVNTGVLRNCGTTTSTNNGNGYTIITKTSSSIVTPGETITYNYTGGYKAVTLPAGRYKLEAWGASGGIGNGNINPVGLGGYTSGELTLTKQTTVYVYVGQDGISNAYTSTRYNGGGAAVGTSGHNGGAGGGATDFRLTAGNWNDTTSLRSRILVAGGGGGAQPNCGATATAGHGGGLTGGTSYNQGYQGRSASVAATRAYSTGGTQTRAGYGYNVNDGSTAVRSGAFGAGATSVTCGAGGGGGYYGGGTGYTSGGGGGSSYVAGYSGCDTTYLSYQQIDGANPTFTNVTLQQGVRRGNGVAKITCLAVGTESVLSKLIKGINNGTMSTSDIQSYLGNAYKYVMASKPYVTSDTIKRYYYLLPDKLANGQDNPLFGNCKHENNTHVCTSDCVTTSVLVCDEPHHENGHYDKTNEICWDACHNDANHNVIPEGSDGKYTAGNFINLDYGFTIYFPNIGTFSEVPSMLGIRGLTSIRGKGYTNTYSTTGVYGKGTTNGSSGYTGMNTSKWTRIKRIKFDVDVIYDGVLYLAGEWITLGDRGTYNAKLGGVGNTTDKGKYTESAWSNYGTKLYNGIYKDMYDFYCVEENSEHNTAKYVVEVTSLNASDFKQSGDGNKNDNANDTTNKVRSSSYASLHGGTNIGYYDVVGRIGNLTMEDVEDFRFSNLFKESVASTQANQVVKNFNYTAGKVSDTGHKLTLTDSFKHSNNAKEDNGFIVTGASGDYANAVFNSKKTYYIVEITGKGLNSGRFSVVDCASGDVLQDEYITTITQSATTMSWYIDLTCMNTGNKDIKYTAISANVMSIESIKISELNDAPTEWLLDGLVSRVDETTQNKLLTWISDIRGIRVSKKTNYVDTWGALNWMDSLSESDVIRLPLSPEKNNIDVLQNDAMLIGYSAYLDITTNGDYWQNDTANMSIIPTYYAINLASEDKSLIPLDAYMEHDNTYVLINAYNNVDKTSDSLYKEAIYNNAVNLDWEEESARRNVKTEEWNRTMAVYKSSLINEKMSEGASASAEGSTQMKSTARPIDIPGGHINTIGNNQFLLLDGLARTFVGGEQTYGIERNIGDRIAPYIWYRQAQRWHFSIGLPSSAVFVRHGNEVNSSTIKEITDGNYIVICTINIVVQGKTFNLKYKQQYNGSVAGSDLLTDTGSGGAYMGNLIAQDADGKDVSINLNDYAAQLDYDPIVFVYNPASSAGQDVEIIKTH